MSQPIGNYRHNAIPESHYSPLKPAQQKLEETSFQILRQNVGRFVRKKIAKTQENVGTFMIFSGVFAVGATSFSATQKDTTSSSPRLLLGFCIGIGISLAGMNLEETGRKKYEAILEEERLSNTNTPPKDRWDVSGDNWISTNELKRPPGRYLE